MTNVIKNKTLLRFIQNWLKGQLKCDGCEISFNEITLKDSNSSDNPLPFCTAFSS